MAGENCTLAVQTYGERRVVVTRVAYGLEILTSSNEDQSRSAKQFHTAKVAYGTFHLNMVFTSWEAREDFNIWMETYLRRLTNPGRQYLYPMRVTIPSRKFERIGIPQGGLRYGDEVARATYPAALVFHAATDPQKANLSELTATFKPAESDDPALAYLYPAGEQLSGLQKGADFAEFDETITINEVEHVISGGSGSAGSGSSAGERRP